jgi:hypothetical protein
VGFLIDLDDSDLPQRYPRAYAKIDAFTLFLTRRPSGNTHLGLYASQADREADRPPLREVRVELSEEQLRALNVLPAVAELKAKLYEFVAENASRYQGDEI